MRIKKVKFQYTLKQIMFTFFIINSLIIVSSCSKYNKVHETTVSSANINNSSNKSVNKEPTDGINPDWKELKEPLPLTDLLDFNWNDVTSITINKYQDNAKVANETIRDKQYISDIASITAELSVVHSYNNVPDDNIVYEIFINQTNDDQKDKFISFGPVLETSKYAIGGTFIESNNLTPVHHLVQTNSEISFNKLQEILEKCISYNSNVTDTLNESNIYIKSTNGMTQSSIKVVNDFVESIKNSDADTLKQIISPSGLIIIRNFASGFGTRGKDIRNLYSANEIPNNLHFNVDGEEPIAFHELFVNSQQTEIESIPMVKLNNFTFNFKDNIKSDKIKSTTVDVVDICTELTSSVDTNDQYSPKLFELGDNEIVLTESALAADYPDGEWAVFEKIDDKYFLKAIIILR